MSGKSWWRFHRVGVLLASMLFVAGIPAAAQQTGAMVDEIIISEETSVGAAVSKLAAGDTDIYLMLGISDPDIFETILEEPELDYRFQYGSFAEIMFNVAGPEFHTGELNPFYYPKIREAVNFIIDREYIVGEILGGMGSPIYGQEASVFPEYERYPQLFEAIEDAYIYDFEKGEEIIAREMEGLGAEMIGGVWHWQGQAVELNFIIRIDLYVPMFPATGDYVADQLERVGFQVNRMHLTGPEAFAIWIPGDPMAGEYHLYTGGWGITAIPRDRGGSFRAADTKDLRPWPRWLVLDPPADYYETMVILHERNYSTLEEREALFEKALWERMEFSPQILLADIASATPFRHTLDVAVNLSIGIGEGWVQTIHFHEEGVPVFGGTVMAEQYFVLSEPWNPVDGTGASADLTIFRDALQESALMQDPRDGLYWPQHIERAEVTVEEGLPIGVTHDWLTLEFADEIQVPLDAWADWDAAEQRFVTVEEKYGAEGVTARRKSVVYYDDDIFDVPMHDGSTLSMGDFILSFIFAFDRAQEESPIFDESAIPGYEAMMASFRGARFITDDLDYPLIVEYYSNLWYLDAEWMVTTLFPAYGIYSQFAPWHVITIGKLAETDVELAFGSDKSEKLGVEWMDYTKGPSIPILHDKLVKSLATNYIPYEPTLGQYITEDEALERWVNLDAWYGEIGHFWTSTAPLYLEAVSPVAGIIELKRFEGHPDPADRWLFLTEPLD